MEVESIHFKCIFSAVCVWAHVHGCEQPIPTLIAQWWAKHANESLPTDAKDCVGNVLID